MMLWCVYVVRRIAYKIFISDNMEPLKEPTIVHNNELGRFFSHCKLTHYIPNRILETIYPDDASVREQWL